MKLGDESFIYENSEEHYGLPLYVLISDETIEAWRVFDMVGPLDKEKAERAFAFGCVFGFEDEFHKNMFVKPVGFHRGGTATRHNEDGTTETVEFASVFRFYDPLTHQFVEAYTAGEVDKDFGAV